MSSSFIVRFSTAAAISALLGSTAEAVFIDLRNLPSLPPVAASVSVDGVTVTLPGPGLNSTATTFGIDGSGPNDKADLLDGGNGFGETLAFLFEQEVIVDSVVISQFGPEDVGGVLLKASPFSEVPLVNGVNQLGGVRVGRTSANFIYWRGDNTSDAGLGFSVDGFNVRLVPEPSTAVIFFSSLAGLVARRRLPQL